MPRYTSLAVAALLVAGASAEFLLGSTDKISSIKFNSTLPCVGCIRSGNHCTHSKEILNVACTKAGVPSTCCALADTACSNALVGQGYACSNGNQDSAWLAFDFCLNQVSASCGKPGVQLTNSSINLTQAFSLNYAEGCIYYAKTGCGFPNITVNATGPLDVALLYYLPTVNQTTDPTINYDWGTNGSAQINNANGNVFQATFPGNDDNSSNTCAVPRWMYVVITNPNMPAAQLQQGFYSEERMLQTTPNYTLAVNATVILQTGPGYTSAVRVLSMLSVIGLAVLSVFAF